MAEENHFRWTVGAQEEAVGQLCPVRWAVMPSVKAFAGFMQQHSLQRGLGEDLWRVCLDLSSSRAVHNDLLGGAGLALHDEDGICCFGNRLRLAKPTIVGF